MLSIVHIYDRLLRWTDDLGLTFCKFVASVP